MNNSIIKLCRYFFTGGVAAIIDVGVYYIFIKMHCRIAPAAAGSFCVANVFNFLLTSRFVFDQGASARKYPLFFFAALIGLTVNVGTTAMGATVLALPAIIAKCLGIAVAFLINFLINLKLVFRKTHQRPI